MTGQTTRTAASKSSPAWSPSPRQGPETVSSLPTAGITNDDDNCGPNNHDQ